MKAIFKIQASYTVTGDITDGPRIELTSGTMLARRFSASVSPSTPRVSADAGDDYTPHLRIDRLITVTGPKLKADDTPGAATGRKHYWLSEDSTPEWVRVIARRIESTECSHIPTPPPVIL